MNTPRVGSLAKACTEVNTPDRTRKVPSSDSENAMIASSTVHDLKAPRFSVTASEWIKAVPASQGMKDAFSTGNDLGLVATPSFLIGTEAYIGGMSLEQKREAIARARG